ncbi:MAG: carboxypeptidase regulatory-like domain-containing protein [Terracidiphilus sp.]|nr:carboxypeptidase regulatory-like domain-containing protein [Terracidiphilus sp.]
MMNELSKRFRELGSSFRLQDEARTDTSGSGVLQTAKAAGRAVLGAAMLMAVLVVLLAAPAVRAQGLGRIVGTVTDPSGAAIPGAKVVATQAGTGVATETVSNSTGGYVFPVLPPTTYNISVSAVGFAPATQKGVLLQADQAVTVSIALKVGAANAEEVTVTSEIPQVDTVTGTLSQVVDTARVNELPLNGRNAAALTTLTAGVNVAPNIASVDQGNTKTFPVVVLITSNGARTNMSNYLLDGANNVDEYTNVNAPFPFPDALQEFSVQTSNYAAEYGQNAGGVTNIITKSGTEKYHGDLFEYLRNRVFNAHDHFSTTTVNGALQPYTDPLKRNQFGGVVGGPVAIPHVWSLKKGFFFGGYQGQRWRSTSATTSSNSSLPSTANVAGQFAFTATGTPTTANCVYDPVNKACFPYTNTSGNNYVATIPTARFDKAALALLNYVPVAAANGTPYTYFQNNSQDYDEFIGKYDQELTAKDRMTLRYFWDKFHFVGVLDPKNYLTYQDQSDILYQSAMLSETHTFNDHILNSFILSYQRENSERGPLPGGINMNTLGVNVWQPTYHSIQSISVSGNFSIGQNPHAIFKRSNVTLAEDVHWVKNTHNISFGFHGEMSRLEVINENGQPGSYGFNSTTTNNAMASFFLGYMSSFSQASGSFQNTKGKFLGTYVQDSWKPSHRLTLDYGVRWEPFIPQAAAGRIGAFNAAAYAAGTHSSKYPNAPAGLLFAGDQGVVQDGLVANYKNFMPRLGFAYDVFGNGKTALRGGTGMFFDTRVNDLFNNAWIGSIPFVMSYSMSNPTASDSTATFSNPFGKATNPFPSTLPLPSTVAFSMPMTLITFESDGHYPTPLLYNWNLALEQQITHSLSSRIAYVGSHGTHLFTCPEINPSVQKGSTDTTGNENSRRLYQNFGSIAKTEMGGNSNYNSLQVTLSQRNYHGVSGTLNYTWSKSLDNIPYQTPVTSAGNGASYVLPIYMSNYKRLDYGPSVFDHRNNISLSYVWAFPKVKDAPFVLRQAVNGWQTSGIFAVHSGDALNVIVNSDVSLAGLGSSVDVPIRAGNGGYGTNACSYGTAATTTCVSYLDPTAFTKPAADTFGNVKKDSFVGPRYINWDASLTRGFGLHREGTELRFRAEYFNLANHTNLGDPNLQQTSASFGRITSDVSPRIAQLSLKVVF